jgi:succinoglycan biosynthesis protein ExoO
VPGVCFRGKVDDLGPEYAAASLAVVPLLEGSGLKIKLVDALRHGCPAVATSVAMQGLGFAENRCAVRADSPEEFAAAVTEIMQDPRIRRNMGLQAIELVQERFSPKACAEPLLRWLSNAECENHLVNRG